MRKKIIVCLSVIGLINCLQGQQFSITARINAENGITINSATSTLNSSSTLSSFGINSIRRAYPNTNNSILNKFLSFKSTGNVDTLIKRLNSLGIFSIIKKDEQVRTMVCNTQISSFANDPVISNGGVNNYALNLIEAPCAWNITRGDSRIVLGIADTEFDINHQDLIFKINSTTGPSSAGDHHGTHVSGVAACHTNNGIGIASIGYNSRLRLRRIPHTISPGFGTWAHSSDIRDAIWELHLNNVRIINVSWGGTGLEPAAAQEIVNNGASLVVSAGNSVNAEFHTGIANIPGVIMVSSVNQNNMAGPTNHARNQWVDLCAPGINVASTAPNNNYSGASGTSFAAPLVAGTIGLMRALNPCLTPPQIETIIKGTTDPIADRLSFPGLIGTGRLNAFRAVQETLIQGTLFQQNRLATGTTKYPTGNTTLWGNTSLVAGRSVTTGTIGNVIIPSGSNVKYEANVSVDLHDGFEVMTGSTFEINVRSSTCY